MRSGAESSIYKKPNKHTNPKQGEEDSTAGKATTETNKRANAARTAGGAEGALRERQARPTALKIYFSSSLKLPQLLAMLRNKYY